MCEKNEVKEAMTMLEGDSSGLAGVNQPLISGNYEIVCDLIRNKVKEDRPKDIIKKILIG